MNDPATQIVVTIKTVPGKRDEYLKRLKAHGERCLATEPGTLKFEILLPVDQADTVMLYEVYASPEAFQEHRTGPSMKQVMQDESGLRISLAGVHCNLADETTN
jgi:quinol monooxygenase YgiN